MTYLEAGKIIEECGGVAVTIHARTKEQGFSGPADWSIIKKLKVHIGIPVIGNGNVFEPQDAKRMFDETGCDAVMVGRAAICNPWIFRRIKRLLDAGDYLPEADSSEKIDLAIRHFDMAINLYGLPRAVFMMRSIFCNYLRGLRGNAEIRTIINRLLQPAEIKEVLITYKDNLENENQVQASQLK
jgi:tRNA-dihydrouridine synthase B